MLLGISPELILPSAAKPYTAIVDPGSINACLLIWFWWGFRPLLGDRRPHTVDGRNPAPPKKPSFLTLPQHKHQPCTTQDTLEWMDEWFRLISSIDPQGQGLPRFPRFPCARTAREVRVLLLAPHRRGRRRRRRRGPGAGRPGRGCGAGGAAGAVGLKRLFGCRGGNARNVRREPKKGKPQNGAGPGKWKHGRKSCGLLVGLMLTHAQMGVSCLGTPFWGWFAGSQKEHFFLVP